MDDEEATAEIHSRITRRRVLRAGVIATGAIWVAPVVDSFVSKAAAASGPTKPICIPSGQPCDIYHPEECCSLCCEETSTPGEFVCCPGF